MPQSWQATGQSAATGFVCCGLKRYVSYVDWRLPAVESDEEGGGGGKVGKGRQVLIGRHWPQVSLAADLNYSHVLAFAPALCINSTEGGEGGEKGRR